MPVSKFKAKRWIISKLDVARVEKALQRGKPPISREDAADFYIEIYDTLAEMAEKFEFASRKMPKLENQLEYWKNKALKAQPRITPIKYE